MPVMTSAPSLRMGQVPRWYESLLFVALMSGPPKFRNRDPFASLSGEVDLAAMVQIGVWICGGLWLLIRLYPALLRRNVVPSVSPAQALGLLFIASFTLSLMDSPGVLLTAFSLGQFAVMLGFAWLFIDRFGPTCCLRHLFIGVSLLAVVIVGAVFMAPDLVGDDARIRGDVIADAGSVAVMGLVLCLSNMPRLRGPLFWGVLTVFGALLVASRTRSAFAALLVFLVIGLLYGRGLRVRQLVVPLALLALSVYLMDALTSTTDYLVRERESVETMSDRIPLWAHLTDAVMREAPLTGLGYAAASRVVSTEYNPALGNAHSVFFEVLVGGGLLGAALYLMLCAALVWFAVHLMWRASGQPAAVASAGLLVASLLMGITSPAALQPGPLGFAFWSLTALLPRLWRDASALSPGARRWQGPVWAGRPRGLAVSPSRYGLSSR